MYPLNENEWQTDGESLNHECPQDFPGGRVLRKLEQEESTRVFKLSEKFNNSKGAVIAFQKNAWNSLRSINDSDYSLNSPKRSSSIPVTKNGRISKLWVTLSAAR